MDQQNVLTSAELVRCGIASIEQALQHGPVHRSKRNRPVAFVIRRHHDRQLQLKASRATKAEASALQWLLALPASTAPRSKVEIDASALIVWIDGEVPRASSTQAILQQLAV